MALQLLINCIDNALIYVLVGLGLSLVVRISHTMHFSYAAISTLGSVIALQYYYKLGLVAVLAGLLFGSLLAISMEWLIFSPVRKRGDPMAELLASLGGFIVISNSMAYVWGNSIISIHGYYSRIYSIGQIYITSGMCLRFIISSLLILLFSIILNKTQIGIRLKAIGSNSDLAVVYGLDTRLLYVLTTTICSLMMISASLLAALDKGIRTTDGLSLFLAGIVIVWIAGTKSIPAILMTALGIAALQSLAAWYLGGIWVDIAVYSILVLFLTISGRKQSILIG
jgi:branched-chain amino acid transport system permease protein